MKGSYSSLFNMRLLRGLLSLSFKGYFVQRGWLESYKSKQSVDENNNPIPWLTYSFLDFLEGRLHSSLKLFEYGSGNSTKFFSKHLNYIRSIEHDQSWFTYVQKEVPAQVHLTYVPIENETENYEKVILEENQLYDIILIDGRRRVKCAKNAIQRLSAHGVIILDDSERDKYHEIYDFMKQHGFKNIPFSGIAIGAIHHKCTTLFYRTQNVFDI